MNIEPERLVELAARALAGDFIGLERCVRAELVAFGVRCSVVIEPVALPVAPVDTLTPCQRAALDLLRQSCERWTVDQIVNRFRLDHQPFEEQTIRNCLSELVRMGYLSSPGRGRRGGYAAMKPTT